MQPEPVTLQIVRVVIKPYIPMEESNSTRLPFTDASYDVIVYGATPGGIAGALSAARGGARTLLLSTDRWIGGMSASGLCTTDAVRREAFGGVLLEFVGKVRSHYASVYGEDSEEYKLCREGWWYEPHVASRVFEDMTESQERLDVWKSALVHSVNVEERNLNYIEVGKDGHSDTYRITGRTFIDATYEGDLAALAGVPFRVAREARLDFGESLAGVVYFDWKTGRLLTESTGESHSGIQAYCYRHTLTDNPENQVLVPKPEYYEDLLPAYLPLLDDIAEGRVKSMEDVTMTNVLPNRKLDANGQIEGLTSFNLPGENWAYPEATSHQRGIIRQRHRLHSHGMIYFMQNDKRVPEFIRGQFNRWHFCADEYPDNANQPHQLYIRQARRIVGRITLSQHDYTIASGCLSTPKHIDAIAVAEHSFDIHPCQSRAAAVNGFAEGVLWYPNKADGPAQPGQVPYRAMLPEHLDNLLVPVALSATHVAFSVLRMEPVWMATGQAAGLAAAMALQTRTQAANIIVADLQKELLSKGQIIDFSDQLES